MIPPSIFTLYASPVKSYGGDAGVVFFCGAEPPGRSPLWFIERSSRRWGAEPPAVGGRNPLRLPST